MKTHQIPLNLEQEPSYEMADFIVSSSNAEAYGFLENSDAWPVHAVALVGGAASGKSHLAIAWGTENDAVFWSGEEAISDLPHKSIIIVEDADTGSYSDDTLFHLFNWTKEIGSKLLFTARTNPNQWQVGLPDLVSRLATVAVASIKEPDDELLMVLLIKLFSDRQLQVDVNVIQYLVPRIERSFESAKSLVEKLDHLALSGKRKITRQLAKECLETQMSE